MVYAVLVRDPIRGLVVGGGGQTSHCLAFLDHCKVAFDSVDDTLNHHHHQNDGDGESKEAAAPACDLDNFPTICHASHGLDSNCHKYLSSSNRQSKQRLSSITLVSVVLQISSRLWETDDGCRSRKVGCTIRYGDCLQHGQYPSLDANLWWMILCVMRAYNNGSSFDSLFLLRISE